MKGLIFRSSTELLACSDVASEYFYGERNSTLIYNGIDTESYKKADDFDALSYARKLGADGAKSICSFPSEDFRLRKIRFLPLK